MAKKKWDIDNKGRHYYNQKSINVKTFKGKCRREEVIISRLKSTLFLMGKCISNRGIAIISKVGGTECLCYTVVVFSVNPCLIESFYF